MEIGFIADHRSWKKMGDVIASLHGSNVLNVRFVENTGVLGSG
jgi:hypothetical protein